MRFSLVFLAPLAALSAISLLYFQSQLPPQPLQQRGERDAENWQAVPVLEGLNRPWGIAWLPNGDALITEKDGNLRWVKDGKLQTEAVAGVPKVFSDGQGALMDVSPHPNFNKNQFVYLTFSAGDNRANRTEIARGKWKDGTLEDVETIYRVSRDKSGGAHFGSRIVWLPDGTFLVSIGDGGNPPASLDGDFIRKQAQNTATEFGKTLRLNADGTPAKDNPLAESEGVAKVIYSWGHRNIQGMARDPKSGRIYATEHGPRGGDELNLIEKGKNYGWPVVTYGAEYHGPKISEETSRPEVPEPLAVWTPSLGPSGLTFYNGDKMPGWKGNLFAGQLAGKEISRFTLGDDGKPTGQFSMRFPQRVRDVRQGPDGFLYVLTDDQNGKLLRLEAK